MAPLVTAAQFGGLQPNIQGAIQQGLATRAMTQDEANRQQLADVAQSQLATRQRALGVSAQVPEEETQLQAQMRAIADDPALADKFLTTVGLDSTSKREEAAAFAFNVRNAPEEEKNALVQQRVLKLQSEGRDASDTMELLDQEKISPTMRDTILEGVEAAALTAAQRQTGTKEEKIQFGGQQTFKDTNGNLFFGTTKRNPSTGAVESVLAPISGGEAKPVGKVKLVSPLGETAAEQLVSSASKERQKEIEKLKAQKKYKPQIEKSVIEARKAAQNRGDIFNELSQAKAAMPGLTAAVDELKELSTIATSTFGGRVFDSAVKETGFGATKGATARAKFIAIVNNQVLPLLKPTFGGSFSVQEGESLKATMGDPDSSPAEKMAQLEAFIAQKIRDIETKQSQLGLTEQPTSKEISISLPQGVTEEDITATMQANSMTREQVLGRLQSGR